MYVQRLPDDSLTHALMRGGREFFGWGQDRYIAVDTFDALQTNTVVSGNWKKKAPEIDPYPRPGAEENKQESDKSNALQKIWAQLSG
jgi:hypothetical protein